MLYSNGGRVVASASAPLGLMLSQCGGGRWEEGVVEGRTGGRRRKRSSLCKVLITDIKIIISNSNDDIGVP